MQTESAIILDVQGVEADPSIPQTTVTPRFYRVHTRTTEGPFDLRIELGAAPKLAARINHALGDPSVQFLGPAPYDLPVAQSATAAPGSDAVTVSFRVLVSPTRVEAVRITISNNQALELAAAIAQAASE